MIERRNWSSYAATADRPASTHEDLMYIHPDGQSWRAWYADSEGHIIDYRATVAAGQATFESDADGHGMRYRLRYETVEPDRVIALTFEVAPPGLDFASYVTGRLERSAGTRSG